MGLWIWIFRPEPTLSGLAESGSEKKTRIRDPGLHSNDIAMPVPPPTHANNFFSRSPGKPKNSFGNNMF